MNEEKQPARERAGGRAFQVKGESRCQDPEAGKGLVCVRNKKRLVLWK